MSLESSSQETPTAPQAPTEPTRAVPGSRWHRLGRRLLVAATVVCSAGASILLLAWLTLHWGILPRVQHWKPDVESWASRAAGAPVTIGTIAVSGGLWAPVLRLTDVAVRPGALAAAAGAPAQALHLGRVEAEIVPASLLPRALTDWRPTLRRLRIDQAQLDVRRDAQGALHLAGLAIGAEAGEEAPALDWLLNQRDIELDQGRLTWTDALGMNEPVVLERVRLRLQREGRQHRIDLGATPPSALAGPVRASGVFNHPLFAAVGLGHGGDWRHWRGTLHLELERADVGVLQRHVRALARAGVSVHSGQASVTARLRIDQARLSSGEATVALREVAARLGPSLEPLALRSLDTRLEWAQGQAEGPDQIDRLQATGLRFETAERLLWPASDLTLHLRRDGQAAWHGGETRASRLDLALLARLSRQVPLAGPLRKFIDQTRPAGELIDLHYRWEGPLELPSRYRYAGQARDLQFDAAPAPRHPEHGESPGRPGVKHAQLRFDGDEHSGRADLEMADGSLEFPGVFAEPVVPLQQLKAAVQWRVERPAGEPTAWPAVVVTVSKARFRNADASGDLSGTWRTGPRPAPTPAASAPMPFGSGAYLPGRLDLQARIDRADARRVHRYLPVRLPAAARQYVHDAVRGGVLTDLQARVQGDLADFPFARARSGIFQIRAHVSDGELVYLPTDSQGHSDWPALTAVNGELLFDRQSLQVQGARARVGSIGEGRFEIEEIDARINDFLLDPVLRLTGRGQGPLADALLFVHRSPLDGWLGQALTQAEARGDAALQLTLQLPLDAHATVPVGERARGSVELRGNELQIVPDTPRLQAVRGRVQFSDAGFEFEQLRGEALGGPVQARGGLPRDGSVRIVAQGQASAEGLRANRDLPWLASLATQLAGRTDYELVLGFPQGEPDIRLESSLQGLTGLWPAPLTKTAAQAWPLKVMVGPSARLGHPPARDAGAPGSAAAPSRQWIRVELAGTATHPPLSALYERIPASGDRPEQVLRGALQVGPGTPALPDRGVQAVVELDQLRLDPWLRWRDHDSRAWLGPPATAVGAGDADGLMPTRVQLRTNVLELAQRRLSDVRLALVHEPASLVTARPAEVWSGRIEARETAGQFVWRLPPEGEPQLQARLRRLSLPARTPDPAPPAPAPSATGPATGAAPDRAAQRLPALDVVVDSLEARGLALGRLSIQGAHRALPGNANARDWQLDELRLDTPEASLRATGRWLAADPRNVSRSTTELDFQLQLRDSGRFLQRLGQADTLRDGGGQLSGHLRWDGSPMDFEFPQLQGSLKLALDRGRFLRADPGAARLLGVLSLQSLPRRLLFDFSDLTQDGFSFDAVEADVAVAAGVASTQNLRIRGVQAAIISQGQADLIRETQDLHVWVVPDVNAGAASLAYAIVNPAVGLGTLLGQLVLRESLAEAATREFQISGRWSDPKVDELPRRRPAPVLPRPTEPPASGVDSTRPP